MLEARLFDVKLPFARLSWGGVALFGGVYLALCFTPGFAAEVRPRLLSSRLITAIEPYVVDRAPEPIVVSSTATGSTWFYASPVDASPNSVSYRVNSGGVLTPYLYLDSDHFQRTGHALLSLALGFFGGLVVRRRNASSIPPANPS